MAWSIYPHSSGSLLGPGDCVLRLHSEAPGWAWCPPKMSCVPRHRCLQCAGGVRGGDGRLHHVPHPEPVPQDHLAAPGPAGGHAGPERRADPGGGFRGRQDPRGDLGHHRAGCVSREAPGQRGMGGLCTEAVLASMRPRTPGMGHTTDITRRPQGHTLTLLPSPTCGGAEWMWPSGEGQVALGSLGCFLPARVCHQQLPWVEECLGPAMQAIHPRAHSRWLAWVQHTQEAGLTHSPTRALPLCPTSALQPVGCRPAPCLAGWWARGVLPC